MVRMWTVALVAVVLVVVAVVVVVARRPRGDDIHSVRNYHHALGTLEHLSERIGPPTVRPVRVVPTGQGAGGGARVVPPVPVRGTDEFPDPDAPIVFDDARPVERGRSYVAEPTPPARTDRAQRLALDSMNHRRRPGTGVLVVAVVVAVFVALAVIGSHRGTHRTTAATTTTAPHHGAASTSTTAPHPTTTTRPTPTTLPTQFAATTTGSGGTSATYTLPHTTYRLTLTGTGSCWVQVDSSATGSTVWAGELSAGTVQQVPASGTTTVQFGTPAVTLEVDGIPVVLPTPLRTPFVATFSPSSSATPGTTVPTTVPASGATPATSSGSATTTTTTAGSPVST